MPRAIAGARALLYFNGNTLAGWCTGVNGTETTQLQRVDVLGNIDSEEIEPVGRIVTLTADFVRILEQNLQQMGIWPAGDTGDIINFPEITAELYDEVGDAPIYTFTGLACESRTWRVDRTGLMTVNATFQARTMR